MPKKTGLRYPQEFKAEAVQLAHSSPEKSIRQLAYELGIADQTLRNWIRQAEIDHGEREGLTTQEREELTARFTVVDPTDGIRHARRSPGRLRR